MAFFSIIVPCYNISKRINKLLSMLAPQGFLDYEVVLVDDCSPDNSFDMMKDECKNFSNFCVVQTPQNGGPGPARNLGLQHASGEYVLFCDSDDVFDVACLPILCDFLLAHPETDMIVSPHEIIRNNKCIKYDTYSEYDDRAAIPAYAIAKGNGGPVAKVYKNSIIQKNQVQFASRMIGEDKYFVVNYAKFVNTAFKLDLIYYKYYMNSQSLTHQQGQFFYQQTIFDLLQPVYSQYFPEIEEIMFVEDHLLEQAKQMCYAKCSCKEIKVWFARENQRYPEWIDHVGYEQQSLYRKLVYKAIYQNVPIMLKGVMLLRSMLY